MKKLSIIVLILMSVLACKRFNSNEHNKKLIQGEWRQVEITFFTESDIISEPLGDEKTILIFRGDTCIEKIENVSESRLFLFDIRDYYIRLEEKDLPITYLQIGKLTEDSLILRTEDRILRYIKENE